MSTSGRRGGLVAIIGILAVALVGALVVAAVVVVGGGRAEADELLLEPIGYISTESFSPSVVTRAEQTVRPDVVKVQAPAGGSAGGQQVPGAQPGLYGGTKNNATCDPEQLIAFLQSNPDKASAWAGVLGIGPTEIPTYVRALTSIVLTRDTRVTNHGFANARATTIPAVLQAGTAVMVDRFGVPRVKCGCGNPLTEPPALKASTVPKGTQWSGFSMNTVVQVTVSVETKVFVLVDINTAALFTRPPGAPVTSDGEVLTDQRCQLFPQDPTCTGASSTSTSSSSTSTSTATTTTATPTTPAASVTTTPPPPPTPTPTPTGARADEAAGVVRSMVNRCAPESAAYVTSYAARELDRDTLYQVDTHVVLDSGEWTAHFEVDFASEFPVVRGLNSESQAFVC